MKKTILLLALLGLSPNIFAQVAPDPYDANDYGPAAMIGISYGLSGSSGKENLGFTAKVLSSSEEEQWVGALGATYYPWSAASYGIDISAGYNFSGSSLLIGYDFIKSGPLLSAGWAGTESEELKCPPPFTLSGGVCI